MKTYGVCSDCGKNHNWREIDYDNNLYVSEDKAVAVTLCPVCRNKFFASNNKSHNLGRYKQKINAILKGNSNLVFNFNLNQQFNTMPFLRLSF